MSKLRQEVPAAAGDLNSPPEGDLQPYAVFTQIEHGKGHLFAGWLDAADDQMALQFARDHYGRDQPCVDVWVVPRSAIITMHPGDVAWRLSDQSYRQARGYNYVRRKWEKFRKREDVAAYAKDDLKEAF